MIINDKQQVHKSAEMKRNASLEQALEYIADKKKDPEIFVNGRRNEIRSQCSLRTADAFRRLGTMVPTEVHDITRENLPRVLERIILPLFS